MFVGTYVGGSINFNAVALEYDVMTDGVLYAGAAVVDNLATTLWMMATVLLPKLLQRSSPAGHDISVAVARREPDRVQDVESFGATEIAVLVALGTSTLWLSNLCANWAEQRFDISLPSILILTTIALILAQLPAIQKLRGGHVLGWFTVLIFLAVIGALCDIAALARLGDLAPSLLAFVFTTVAIHGMVVFGGALLLRLDLEVAAVASQANIGGGTSALALARSLDRSDLGVSAILVGSLGNALGTYLGFLTAALLA